LNTADRAGESDYGPVCLFLPATDRELPTVPETSRSQRCDYPHLEEITTRWADNDVYGHVNNVVYYGFFDTVVNRYLLDCGVLDLHGGAVIGLVVETGCRYFAPIAFPEAVMAGLRVARIGNSSVRYEIGIFRDSDEVAAAEGYFVHVYVDRGSRRPIRIPDDLRKALAALET
jgi:acyl-CoA thioester hydrolase